jgi:hypothetical protein
MEPLAGLLLGLMRLGWTITWIYDKANVYMIKAMHI